MKTGRVAPGLSQGPTRRRSCSYTSYKSQGSGSKARVPKTPLQGLTAPLDFQGLGGVASGIRRARIRSDLGPPLGSAGHLHATAGAARSAGNSRSLQRERPCSWSGRYIAFGPPSPTRLTVQDRFLGLFAVGDNVVTVAAQNGPSACGAGCGASGCTYAQNPAGVAFSVSIVSSLTCTKPSCSRRHMRSGTSESTTNARCRRPPCCSPARARSHTCTKGTAGRTRARRFDFRPAHRRGRRRWLRTRRSVVCQFETRCSWSSSTSCPSWCSTL